LNIISAFSFVGLQLEDGDMREKEEMSFKKEKKKKKKEK
jgi:hypothetical protein